jgi:hypothetical protein
MTRWVCTIGSPEADPIERLGTYVGRAGCGWNNLCKLCPLGGNAFCQKNVGNIGLMSEATTGVARADDFVSLGSELNRLCVWGEYLNAPEDGCTGLCDGGCEGGEVCSEFVTNDVFTITVYADNGQGLPDLDSGVSRSGDASGSGDFSILRACDPYKKLSFPHPPDWEPCTLFQYKFEFRDPVTGVPDPIILTPGQRYWIEVVNDPVHPDACEWYWSPSVSDGNGYSLGRDELGYDAEGLVPTDMAFCLDVEADVGAWNTRNRFCGDLCHVRFVDATRPVGGDGLSWETAFKYLQDALDATRRPMNRITEIWVADGTYTPDEGATQTPGDRGQSFDLIDGVAIYGGFGGYGDGDEAARMQRDPAEHQAILSGDLGHDDVLVACAYHSPDCDAHGRVCVEGACIISDNNTENSCHVIRAENVDNTAILDGVTVTGGNANYCGTGHESDGAGIIVIDANPSLATCQITGNSAVSGGGIVVVDNAAPSIENTRIVRNTASDSGGGVYNALGSLEIMNSTLAQNTAACGGGLHSQGGSATLINCLLRQNSADMTFGADPHGGGLYLADGGVVATNCTLAENSAYQMGGLYVASGTVAVTNTILWNNTAVDPDSSTTTAQLGTSASPAAQLTVTYSCIQDENPDDGSIYTGMGNIDGDPLFLDPDGADDIVGNEDDNYRLSFGSPCLDAGDNASLPDPPPVDRDGRVRIRCNVDMGPYELPVLFVDDDAEFGGNGQSWSTAYKYLQDALDEASIFGDSLGEIWVADGEYTPDDDERGNVDDDDESASFELRDGVRLAGGFAGTEACFEERSLMENESILSGDLGHDDVDVACTDHSDCDAYGDLCVEGFCIRKERTGQTSQHIVWSDGNDTSAMLDGLTITRGNGGGFSAGIYIANGTPVITRCMIFDNEAISAAGMYVWSAAPSVSNCVFFLNRALASGGGLKVMGAHDGEVHLTNCQFLKNQALSTQSGDGGGVSVDGSTEISLTNCTFSGNTAARGGGGVYMGDSAGSVTLTNSSFSLNSAGAVGGGGLHIGGGSVTVTNSILWGNADDDPQGGKESEQIHVDAGGQVAVTYSCIMDEVSGDGDVPYGANPPYLNIDGDPAFSDADGADNVLGTLDDDLSLQETSPCEDRGNDDALPADVTDLDGDRDTSETLPLDLAGNRRAMCKVDMGAYEVYAPVPAAPEPAPSDEEPGYEKNRYLSFMPASTTEPIALRVMLVESGRFPEAVGAFWWVGAPEQACENSGYDNPPPACPGTPPLPSSFKSAALGCTPQYMDWHGVCEQSVCDGGLKDGESCVDDQDCQGVLHVYGEGIVPARWHENAIQPMVYAVQAIYVDCNRGNEENFSPPLVISMSRWGDVAGSCTTVPCAPPDGQVDITPDIVSVLDKFKNLPGSPMKVRCDITPETDSADLFVDITDVESAVEAFNGLLYPFSAPESCP